MRRTCNNVFDWLKPTSMIIQTSQDNTDIIYKHDVQLIPNLNNIQIIIEDKTAHTPELGPPSVHTIWGVKILGLELLTLKDYLWAGQNQFLDVRTWENP
jgi:hypothetical protein